MAPYITVFAVVVAVLAYYTLKMWTPEIRALLIPNVEIEKAANDLIKEHGIKRASTIALDFCQNAMERNDLYQFARWDRVARRLRKIKSGEVLGSQK
jgi:hypothetical protein